jgi:hypothetical protein
MNIHCVILGDYCRGRTRDSAGDTLPRATHQGKPENDTPAAAFLP